MSVCVLDSSAWVSSVVAGDERGERVLATLETFHEWWAPDAFDLEVLSALRGHLLRGLLSAGELHRQAVALVELPLQRISTRTLLSRIASLAPSVSTYDAAFVALAELLDAPLLTTDSRLARAPGPRCEFLLVEDN